MLSTQRWPRYISKVPRYRFSLLTLKSIAVPVLGVDAKKDRLGTFVMFVLHICVTKIGKPWPFIGFKIVLLSNFKTRTNVYDSI